MIGLISDTHGLLRTGVLDHLKGSELIIHAGDVGDPAILTALREIAPVVAVRGNIDKQPPLNSLPFTATENAGSRLIYVLHDIAALDINPAAAGFAVVVFGHSHKPEMFQKKGVTYINPGSIGPRRFRLPISFALLDIGPDPVEVKFVTLDS